MDQQEKYSEKIQFFFAVWLFIDTAEIKMNIHFFAPYWSRPSLFQFPNMSIVEGYRRTIYVKNSQIIE